VSPLTFIDPLPLRYNRNAEPVPPWRLADTPTVDASHGERPARHIVKPVVGAGARGVRAHLQVLANRNRTAILVQNAHRVGILPTKIFWLLTAVRLMNAPGGTLATPIGVPFGAPTLRPTLLTVLTPFWYEPVRFSVPLLTTIEPLAVSFPLSVRVPAPPVSVNVPPPFDRVLVIVVLPEPPTKRFLLPAAPPVPPVTPPAIVNN